MSIAWLRDHVFKGCFTEIFGTFLGLNFCFSSHFDFMTIFFLNSVHLLYIYIFFPDFFEAILELF